jgi:flagellar biogenesis protein FliO
MTIETILQDVFHTAKRNSPRPQIWRGARIFLRKMVKRIRQVGRRSPRRLRLCESLPLGDRRFVAVVEFEQSRFLLGGTAASLVLLARLEDGQALLAADSLSGVIPTTANAEGSR